MNVSMYSGVPRKSIGTEKMKRKSVGIGLALVVVLGFCIYLRLWFIDSEFSHLEDRELIRQFDIANQEAMEESAEWRLRYDLEVDRAKNCSNQLSQVKQALEEKMKEVASIKRSLAVLQKENVGLLERVETLTKEIATEKTKCNL